MVQCEMCGTEVADPKTVKVEGAELDVCGDCAEFGTEVRQESSSSSSTKYSTSSSSSSSSSSGSGSSGGSSSSSRRRRDMFDEMEEVATDYDERIRAARESQGLSQEELAKQLNEKAGVIRKLERGDTLPTDQVQRKLERALGISLAEGSGSSDDYESDSGGATGTYTLGDVVKRKD
ncbi:multiprotein bridging factor aMBF1 [Halosegnis marinus]|uniref:Multiprotein bridging factor aMBF1 n=1 Tax=Halosegnis marinus TaxID=3034023 RepID=A0ABD5ZSS7_9EURY|nr:multiprotein bridging factor aMBF1 [Halosegnis sp. DT85]